MGLIGSIFSGIFGSNSANKAATVEANASTHAADLQKQAADEALNFSKLQYGNSLNLAMPFINTANSANGRLGFLMGLNPGTGLPPGVVNPNAPTSSAPTLNGSMLDPGAIQQLRALRGGGRTPLPMQGAAGMLQMDANGNPTGTTADVNPFPNGMGALNPTTASTNQGGTGQVPIPNGNPGTPSFNMNTPITSGMFNPNNPNQGLSPDGSAPSGGTFGSLAQGWNKTFTSPTANDMTLDPGWQFRLNQGLDALQNSAAARGGLLSGGTARAVNDYAQGSASQEYGNAYNRALQNYNTNYNTFTNDQTNTFNRLMALMNGGQVSANNLSNSGVDTANNISRTLVGSAQNIGGDLQNAAQARGSGYLNQANAVTNSLNSGNRSLLDLMSMFGGG